MAAVTSTVVALGGIGLSAVNAIKAGKDKKRADDAAIKAEQAMRNVKEQNIMKQTQVPTLGFDLAQEAQAQRDVSQIAALQGAGAAGVIGGIGKVAQAGAAADVSERSSCGTGRSRYRAETCDKRVWYRKCSIGWSTTCISGGRS
jgi:hypothetical protein